MSCSNPSTAQVHVNQVYYPPPGSTDTYGYNGTPMAQVAPGPGNAYGYNGMPIPQVPQAPPNMYSYAGMPMAQDAIAPPPGASARPPSGWCTCCIGPCARWSRKCWVILILITVLIGFALVVALVLTVAVQNGKNGQGYGG